MDPAGNWFARGNNDISEHDWVVRNGVVIAERGAPIHVGATEVYSDTAFADLFYLHVGDSLGNFIIGGVSDNPDLFADGILVLNDQTVIARQGDPIDLDNNGTFDDGVFINTFGNEDGFLDDAGNFYFMVTMMDIAGAAAGDAFLTYDLSGILGGGNASPTMMNVAATSPIDENDSTMLTGDIDDIDEDPFSLVVDWGDGSVMTYTYPSGTEAFTETHQYLDDDPTATPTDMYNVTLVLDDGNGGLATGATSVTVNNVSPTASASADATTVTLGTAVNFTGVFSDVGTLDTHTVDWGFGDGNVASGTLTPTHTYTATGDYVVLLSVEDDDLGVGTDSITITVEDMPPTAVSLSSFGDGPTGPGMML
jgi:PKD repeat protein